MPSVSIIYSGDFLVASQLPAGRRISACIHDVRVETLGSGHKQTQKLALELVSQDGRPWPRRVLLNKTNASLLANGYGDEALGWSGKTIEIWQEQVSFQGRIVPGVRVAAVHQRPAAQSQPARGNGNGANSGVCIPEQPLSDELSDSVPF